jgi:hypothetical protein
MQRESVRISCAGPVTTQKSAATTSLSTVRTVQYVPGTVQVFFHYGRNKTHTRECSTKEDATVDGTISFSIAHLKKNESNEYP